MAPLVSLSEVKSYLGITGTQDDQLIASAASNASIMAESDTSRTFSTASNVTSTISTDGQASIVLDQDRPFSDANRVVTLDGSTLVEGTSCWFLPDRRNPETSITLQVRVYNRGPYGRGMDYRANPNWFDANLDLYQWRFGYGAFPNNLVIRGMVGHVNLPLDVKQAVLELAAWLYWRAKSGASGTVTTPSGVEVSLSQYPPSYQMMVENWKIKTYVAAI